MNYEENIQKAVADNKLSKTAAQNISEWLTKPKYEEYKPELTELIEQEDWKTLDDNFWQVLPFGTGGRRGTVGIGSNRINRVTMGESAQGFAEYIADAIDNAKEKGIVIGYDTRLTSVEFSEFVASVLAANGYKVYLFDSFRATPELSFAVRNLKAAAGVVVSASHNPASDNGFKAYWEDGGQILPPHDTNIIDVASKVEKIKTVDFNEATKDGQIEIIGKEVDDAYIDALLKESLSESRSAQIVYSPLHGTGQVSVLPILAKAGFNNVTTVEEQMEPDGHFPNVENHLPNPEMPETAKQGIEVAKENQADFVLTTDPDADRLGVIAKDSSNEYQFLTGNQIAALIGYHVLSKMKQTDALTDKHFIVRTIVTTDFLDAFAEDFGVKMYNRILIGFKYVAGMIFEKEDNGDEVFVFGGEESHGILKGSYTRDKDAAVAALLLSEQASELKDKDSNLVEQLNQLYKTYGLYWEKLISIFYEGAEGGAKMNRIMQGLRDNPPSEIDGMKVVSVVDKLEAKDGQTGDILIFNLSEDNHTRATIRPSGTEPKIKIYMQYREDIDPDISDQDLEKAKQAAEAKTTAIVEKLKEYTEKSL